MAADLLADGMIKATWAPNVANVAAPTVAELNAGVDLECYIPLDGLDIKGDTASVDNTALCSTDDTEEPGPGQLHPRDHGEAQGHRARRRRLEHPH